MKSGKKLTAFALVLCLIVALTGCSKDTVLENYNNLLHHVSRLALTDEKDLQGEKTEGEDAYTGSYTAEYDDFSGTEYLFGGTGLERENGNNLAITYDLTVDSGTVEFYWRDKDEKKIIADISDTGTYSVTLSEGDNYLTLEGNDFCGSLRVAVK